MVNVEYIKQVGVAKWAIRYFIRQFCKRILKKGVSLKLPTGLTYFAPTWDPSATEVYVTNADADWGSESVLQQVLSKEGTFIDVGAHTGYYSLYMLPCVSWVYAFEPDSQSYNVLKQYSHLHTNLLTFQKALSNQSGTMEIQTQGAGYSFIKDTAPSTFQQNNSEPSFIEVIKIDDFINDYKSQVTGIKIDVDGSDLDVLEGAIQTIKKFQPVVLTELNSGETNRLFTICTEIHYEVYAFTKSIKNTKKTKFMRLSKESVSSKHVKMFFLVPESKIVLFDKCCLTD